MRKRLLCALLAFICLVTCATAETIETDDPVVISVESEDITAPELKQAVRLELFLGALKCAGYGYALDILDPLTIEDEMDKTVFALEDQLIIRLLAKEMDVTLTDDDLQAARADAEAEWQAYRDIAWSDNGMAYLPAGKYVPAADPEETIARYFASFGLTKDVLFQRACDGALEQKLQAAYTAGMEGTDEDLLMAFVEWHLGVFDEAYVNEDTDAIALLTETLWED